MELDPAVLRATDLVVAGALAACSGVVWRRSRAVSLLLAATALAWLLADHWVTALFWHRALLMHLVLAYPDWRPTKRSSRAVVAAAYGVCVLLPTVLLDDRSTVVCGVVLLAAAWWNARGTTGRVQHQSRAALTAAVVYGATMGVAGLVGLGMPDATKDPVLVGYEVSVVVTVLVLVVGLRTVSTDQVAGLVVELGETPADALRDAIARATRDPGVRVGYWDADASVFRDVAGARVDDAQPGPGRAPVPVDHLDDPFALVVLDAGLARDPAVVEAVAAAVRLVAVNNSRTADVVVRVGELEGSRRRLVEAADHERAVLDRELRAGVLAAVDRLAADVRRIVPRVSSTHLLRAADHLERTAVDLADAAAGLRPRDLEQGLGPALDRLAEDNPLSVRVRGEPGVLPGRIELAVWYVCSEALSNAVKHARPTSVEVELSRADHVLRVSVRDDGVGGAGVGTTGGLAGLRDRVTAEGGHLSIDSGPHGTRLVAELPLGDQRA